MDKYPFQCPTCGTGFESCTTLAAHQNTVYITGDWEWEDTLETYGVGYQAVRLGVPVSYGDTPVVTERVARAFVARQAFFNAAYPDMEMDDLSWDGDVLVCKSKQDAEWTGRIAPDDDGNYDLAGLGYCFVAFTECQVDDGDDPIRFTHLVKKED